MQFKVV
jgi:hypothetical protein